jgi:hypothetical protein
MGLACVLSVIASVGGVTVGSVSVMRRFLVMPALVVFSCLSMVPRSFWVMFRCFAMMFSSLFRHKATSRLLAYDDEMCAFI